VQLNTEKKNASQRAALLYKMDLHLGNRNEQNTATKMTIVPSTTEILTICCHKNKVFTTNKNEELGYGFIYELYCMNMFGF